MSNSTRPLTVADLVEHFIHRRSPTAPADKATATEHRAYRRQAERLLRKNVLNRIGQSLACDVTRRELVDLLGDIVRRGAPITANRVYSLLKQCFSFAVAWDLMTYSPMVGMPAPGGRERRRTRILSDAEIPIFWTRVESANMATPTKLGLKLLLVTAQHLRDVTAARWLDFNLDKRVWSIPSPRSGSPRPHTVPLSQLAVAILIELRSITGNSRYALASPRTRTRASSFYSDGVLSHAVLRNEKHWGIARFTPNDLRRTAAAGMAYLDIPRRHIRMALNLSGRSFEFHELRARDHLQEKKAALDKWAGHLQALLGTENPKRLH